MTIRGRVVYGVEAAGPCYGCPTANLHLKKPLPILPGIYAGYTTIPNSDKKWPSVICYGAGLLEDCVKCEVHILDWNGDLYGEEIEVEFGPQVSAIQPFSGIEEMRAKIHDDEQRAREYFERTGR